MQTQPPASAAAHADPRPAGVRAPTGSAPPRAPAPVRLAVLIVTWNRKSMVGAVLEALACQTLGAHSLDVVVIDNASTDGTLDHLAERFSPERIVENPTAQAHRPAFQPPTARTPGSRNSPGFASLTLVHNHANMGGCGGFNTGFSYVEHALDRPPALPPHYLWLVDDDVDLPADAAENLVRVAEQDPSVGLVGSRTVDLNNRDTTIETTIYFDPATGQMADEPVPGHPARDAHRAWVAAAGGTRGRREFTGVRDVDVVSACSLLARWNAVKKVGFWDYRYFIYCDDADWCLRFGKAGYRVVLALDAVVFHTPWHHKLTPARAYYAQRNLFWVIQKILPPKRLRRATLRWCARVLKQSLHAAMHRRLFHAEIIRRSVADMLAGRWGKLDSEGPPTRRIPEALDAAGILRPGRSIAVVCNRPESLEWSAELRDTIGRFLAAAGRSADRPGFIEIVRNDLPGAGGPSRDGVRRVVYSGRLRSKLRRQIPFLLHPPDAIVVYEQDNDFPLLSARFNIHIDRRQPEVCQIEAGGPPACLRFFVRWTATVARTLWYTARLRPYVSPSKYG